MDLDDFLGPEPIVVDLRASDRWEAISELIGHLVANRRIKAEHRDAISASVKERESAMSTGVGYGIGLPHASTDLVCEVVAAMGRSRAGIQFDAIDGKPVNLVMLFLAPKGQFQRHLHSLANIAKILRTEVRG